MHDRLRLHEMQPGNARHEFLDVRIGRLQHDVLGGSDLHEATILHDGDAIADPDGLVEVVGDEYGRLAELLRELAELVLQLASDERIERTERFVHQDDLRVGRECAG